MANGKAAGAAQAAEEAHRRCVAATPASTEWGQTRDGVDLYGAVFQVAGRSTVSHNNQTVQLAKGDVVLVDKARPVSYVADSKGAHWLCLQFPRRPLISHLGFEPQGGRYKRGGTAVGRLLYESKAQPLSEIAYGCGFRDYTHFARKFRHRFGDAPGAHFEGGGPIAASASLAFDRACGSPKSPAI